jgi:endonuclease-3
MPRESAIARRHRVEALIQRLRSTYPEAHCELRFSNPLELLVATILSAQCTDKQVNIVTEELFRKYRSAADYAGADPEAFAHDIRRIGLYRNKARNIQSCCRALMEQHGGEVPRSMDALIALDGVGRKTANVVLGNAFGIEAGIVVDTHVARLSQRLRLSAHTQPEKIEQDLIRWVSQPEWTLFSHWLIWHGRRRCGARSPDCAACEIRELCPSASREP